MHSFGEVFFPFIDTRVHKKKITQSRWRFEKNDCFYSVCSTLHAHSTWSTWIMRHSSCFRGVCVPHWGNRRAIRLSMQEGLLMESTWGRRAENLCHTCWGLAGECSWRGDARVHTGRQSRRLSDGESTGRRQSQELKKTLGGRFWRYDGSM